MLKDDLKEVGLTEKEARIYLAGLELGPVSIIDLARKTKENRTSLYHTVEGLIKRGFFTIIKKGNKKLYSPEDPGLLKRAAQQRLDQVSGIVKDLLALQKKGSLKPIMHMYDGMEGIKAVFQETIYAKEKTIYGFTGIEHLATASKSLMDFLLNEYTALRKKNGVFAKLIIPDTPGGRTYHASDNEKFRESRFVSADKYNFPSEYLVYDDVVCLLAFSEREQFAITIQSKAMADTMKMIFNFMWGQSNN